MMKGDAYRIPINIETAEGAATPESFADVEVCIGRSVRKTLSAGEITYDTERALFLVPITQEETFALGMRSRINIRCKYAGGDVVGIDLGILEFEPSLSREVL
jgi:hypothetical protein